LVLLKSGYNHIQKGTTHQLHTHLPLNSIYTKLLIVA